VVLYMNSMCIYCVLLDILNGFCQAIMAEGKRHALAVGVTKMSSAKMYVVFNFILISISHNAGNRECWFCKSWPNL